MNGNYGAILTDRLCGNSLPKQIRSAGNMVWVHFKSALNAATTFKGFEASFKAGKRLAVVPPDNFTRKYEDSLGKAAFSRAIDFTSENKNLPRYGLTGVEPMAIRLLVWMFYY